MWVFLNVFVYYIFALLPFPVLHIVPFQTRKVNRLHHLVSFHFPVHTSNSSIYLSSGFGLTASLLFHITSRSIRAAVLRKSMAFLFIYFFCENVTSCHFAISGGATQLIYLRYSAIRHLERPKLGLKSVRGISKQRLAAGIPVVNVSIGPSQKSISRTVGTRERAHGDLVINHNAHTNINRAGHLETLTNRWRPTCCSDLQGEIFLSGILLSSQNFSG